MAPQIKPSNDTPRQSNQCPGRAYRYTSFCVQYRAFAKALKRSMALGHPVRQVHRAGDLSPFREKLFVDGPTPPRYAGQTLAVIDPASGEIRRAQVFVAVLGASNYTYAEANWTQTTTDWLGAHCRALAYFGGCPEVVVPDNARALIADPDRYEPSLGRAYREWAEHYGCAVIPARPYRPQDKAYASHCTLCGGLNGVSHQHLQAYLNEFVFRFNRRFYPMTAFNSVLGLASHAAAPTYETLYSGEWTHPIA